jgi:multidrug transporter EmrE-like cation transporter
VTLAIYAAVYVAEATAGLVLLRHSLRETPLAEVIRSPAVYVGFAFYAASFFTFLLALRRFEVLTVYPVFSGVAYATVTLAAWLVLGESLGVARVAGILLVGVGVVFLVR